jgi:hypothetical protein
MKRLILLFLMATLLTSCDNNPDYAKNLATAQKLFQLHEEENIEEQLALVSEKNGINYLYVWCKSNGL